MGKQHCKYSNEFQVNILFPLNVLPISNTVGGIVLSIINIRIKLEGDVLLLIEIILKFLKRKCPNFNGNFSRSVCDGYKQLIFLSSCKYFPQKAIESRR